MSSVPHPLLGGEMLFVHSNFAHLVVCCHSFVRVVLYDRHLHTSHTNNRDSPPTNVTTEDKDVDKEEDAAAEANDNNNSMDSMVRSHLQQFHTRRERFHRHPPSNSRTCNSAVT